MDCKYIHEAVILLIKYQHLRTFCRVTIIAFLNIMDTLWTYMAQSYTSQDYLPHFPSEIRVQGGPLTFSEKYLSL